MNCYKCQKKIKTPNAEYSVSELVELCRPHCLACEPFEMPRGGHSQVTLIENAIAFTSPGDSVDESGDDDAPTIEDGGESFQRVHPDYQTERTGGHADILNVPEEIAVYLEPCLIELVKRFAALDIRDVDILHGLLNGKSCEDMAAAFGYRSRPAVHARLRAALRRNPWLKELHTRGVAYGLGELRHSSPSWQGKIEKPFTRGRGVVLADVPGADPDALANADGQTFAHVRDRKNNQRV